MLTNNADYTRENVKEMNDKPQSGEWKAAPKINDSPKLQKKLNNDW